MAANYAVDHRGVTVIVEGMLGAESWQTLRDARLVASDRHLPLHVDCRACEGVDMAGVSSLLIAQHELGSIAIDGCTESSAKLFGAVGLCERCCSEFTSLPGCRRFAAAA